MLDFDYNPYVNAFFVLIVSSIALFLYITRTLNKEQTSFVSGRYFNLYFGFGVFGWLLHWLLISGESAHFDFPLMSSTFVISGLLMLLAILNLPARHPRVFLLIGAHALVVGALILANTDATRFLITTAYGTINFSVIGVISYRKAKRLRNIGHGIIALSTLIMSVSLIASAVLLLGWQAFPLAFELSVIGSSLGFIAVGIGYLTSVLVSEQQKLALLAVKDPLTGLLNRRGLDQTLTLLLAQSQRKTTCLSAITVDLDHFKHVNDTYGHDGGDKVLIEMAAILTTYLRPSDACSRLGGEEFVIVLPDTPMAEALAIAERIRAHLGQHNIQINDHNLTVTASFGVASMCQKIDLDDLLKQADKALYQSKFNGRDQVCAAG